jgi:hypothetical protein
MIRAKLLSFIGWLLVSLWNRTIRVSFINKETPDRLKAQGNNFIFAFWHGRQLLLLYHHRKSGTVIPASASRDGEIQAGILKRFGFDVVRGSSKRKGDRALLGLVDGLRKGKNVALAVDGPRGPIYEVKQGAAYLAGKFSKVIVPVSASAKRFWILEKIWDKYMLPVPFTKGVIVYGDPITVNGIGEEELESKRRELADSLNRVMKEADEHFKKSV